MAEHAVTVDEMIFALLKAVSNAAEPAGIPWMVTGASGRVLLLESVYGLPEGRATEDVDFVVMVQDWGQYGDLVGAICRNSEFCRDPKQTQRIRYRGDFYLDLVPFGGVESDAGLIAWPPKGDITMSVVGVHEAFADAVQVRVNGQIDVPVGSPTGLFLLKLLAWSERRSARPGRDAADIAYFLRHAAALITTPKLFENHFDVVKSLEYDVELAACFVTGTQVGELASPATRTCILTILEALSREGTDAPLCRDISAYFAETVPVFDLLKQFKYGFEASLP